MDNVHGGQVRVLDFEEPNINDWLAVNQFTVVENRHERRPDIVSFYAGRIVREPAMANPTVVVLTDRNDLRTTSARIALPSITTWPLPRALRSQSLAPSRG